MIAVTRSLVKKWTSVAGAILLLAACRNAEIPLPQTESRFPQPIGQPVRLGKTEKLNFADSFGTIRPVVKSFDVDKLPIVPFNTDGFIPFAQTPVTSVLDWDQLRDTAFNFEKLPARPIRYEILQMDPPRSIAVNKPRLTNRSTQFVYELGEPFSGVSITAILTDRDGLLWIMTEHALYRYDGENCLLYYRLPVGQFVFSMILDRQGQIWMGSNQRANGNYWKGVLIMDIKKGLLKKVTLSQGRGDFSFIDLVMGMDNRIWVAEGGNNVDIIDPQNNVIRHFDQQQGLATGIPNGIVSDSAGIWLGSILGGITIVDPVKSKIKYLDHAHGLGSDSIRCFYRDKNDQIWMGSVDGFIDRINKKDKTITHYNFRQGLNRNVPSSITSDEDGKIWIANNGNNAFKNDTTLDGVEILNPSNGSVRKISPRNGLFSPFINKIKLDNLDQVWIATDNGLNMIQKKGNRLEHIGRDTVSTLTIDKRNRIWVGFLNHGIRISASSDPNSRLLDPSSGLPDNYIQNMISNKGSILIATGGGLDIIDSSYSKWMHLDKKHGLPIDSVATIMVKKDGKIWISMPGTSVSGIFVMDMEKNRIVRLKNSRFSEAFVTDIKEDQSGYIWVATINGVSVLDPAKNIVQSFDSSIGFRGQYNRILLNDATGHTWIGTGEGVFRVNDGLDSIYHLSEKEGLISDAVLSLNEHDGKLYVGTRSGLSIVTPPEIAAGKKWEIQNFGKQDGFNKLTGTYSSDGITNNGEFCWGDLGLTILKKQGVDEHPSATYLQGLNVMNEELQFTENPWNNYSEADTIWSSNKERFYTKGNLPAHALVSGKRDISWDSVTGIYNLPVNLKLPYDQNYLQFHFGQANMGMADTVWYRYILEGGDRKWSERTTSKFSENYLNLSPGHYTFKVSSLYRGQWQEPTAFPFTITPPWWQTWWAYCIYGLSLALLVTLITRYRSRQLLSENLRLEQKVQQRTLELKNSLDNLQKTQDQLVQSEKMASLGELTAGIAHEIQNPLNFVNNFSELNTELFEEMNDELAKGHYDNVKALAVDINENQKKINYHGRRADAIVKGMLQHSRSSTGQKESADINALADEYLRLSYHGLRAKDKSFNAFFNTHFDETIGNINIIPQDIGRVLLNIYNNAFYAVHEKAMNSKVPYEPTVWVSTAKKGQYIIITVRDNGNGISRKDLEKIFQPFFTTKPTGQGTGLGLSLSYDIIRKMHGGDLEVDTKEGEYASFTISLPLRENS